MFPKTRLRRLRNNNQIRSMIKEYKLMTNNLVQPLFIKETLKDNEKVPIPSMPGIFQHSINSVIEESHKIAELGIPAIILFGIPKKKDPLGSEAYNPDGIIPRTVRKIKENVGEKLLIACDVCLCEYTDHGHCAPIKGNVILNEKGNELYSKTALEYVKAGADIIAPSGMMDGMVKSIRDSLERNHFEDTIILSYAIKYASSFYGPFRDAVESSFKAGPSDRKTHQMDPSNLKQAFIEAEFDIQEGADILMVKPALPYLDVIKSITDRYNIPVSAYQVSGEYSMIKAAGQNGWIDEELIMMETLLSIRRAGATIILTYFAKKAAEKLN